MNWYNCIKCGDFHFKEPGLCSLCKLVERLSALLDTIYKKAN